MSGHQTATIEDTVYFWIAANDTSGSGGDGATPLFDVREAGAAAGAIPLLSGTPTLLSHANFPAGCHEIAVAATVANGFAENDTFAVFCTLLIDSQNPSGFIGSCTLTPLAKSSEVSNLTVAGSASKVPAKLSPNGFVITWGENEANNEDATRPLDGVTHDIEAQNDTGTEKIDAYYEAVNIGAGTPSEVTWHGRLDKGGGATKNIDVQVEDVDAGTWRTIGNIISSNSLETHTFDIFINEVGTGADLGTARVRFLTGSIAFTATTKLITDQIFLSFNPGTVSGLDAVYFDSTAGNTGTTSTDGVPGNPVSTEAAVNTLLAARNLKRVHVAIGSSVTFGTDHTGEEWIGDNWTLGLGARALASCLFIGATVSGTHTGAARFEKCELGTISTAGMVTDNCGHDGTITITAAGTYIFNNDHSEVAGANTPVIDMGAAVGNVDLAMPDYHNGIEIQNFNATGTDEFSISGIGQIIYAASSSGTVNQRGNWKVTNTGGVTITPDDNTANASAILEDTADIQPNYATEAKQDTQKAETVLILQDTADIQPNYATEAKQDAQDAIITEARLAELDPANLPADIAALNDLDAAGIRAAIGMAAANLDTQLAAIAAFLDTEIAAILLDTGTNIPALIAALNDLDAVGIRAAMGLASANVDTQFAASATVTGHATEAKQDAQDAIITEVRLAELDAGNLPTDIAAIPTAVENRQEMDSNSVQLNTTLPALIDDLAIKKNTAGILHISVMVLTSDHVTPATGLTVTAQRLIDSGTYVNVAGTMTEISNGTYRFDYLAADSNGDMITWRFSAATADDAFVSFKTVA